jgi:glycosyltransferase involved in cell wall biosynthesis
MPYVLLEAAAATLPIITTTVVNPDLVDHCEQIRAIPPGNVEAIAEAIKEKVLEREENELFPTSRHFEFSKMLAKTTALYR